MRWLKRFLAVMSLAALTACASLPIQEMSDARQAIRAARDAGAETYATQVLDAAERRLDSAADLLAGGDYEGSREAAIDARREAVRARLLALEQQESTE